MLPVLIGLTALLIDPTALDGQWSYSESRDPFTDETSTQISVFADDDDQDALLVVVCGESDPVIVYLIEIRGFMAGNSQNQILVRYRVDRRPATDPAPWSLGDRSTYADARMPSADVSLFLSQARAGESVLFEARGARERRQYTFSLSGFQVALAQLGCNRLPGEEV